LERGCKVTGIELEALRVDLAKGFLAHYVEQGTAEIINLNIYEEAALQQYRDFFDLIILKDVIEHIPEQERFIPYLKQFLKPGGSVFFGFPPWYMPHGGHQQLCQSRFLTFLPYFHLLPAPMYRWVLKLFGEHEGTIAELLGIKRTGISIERFERIVKKSGYSVEQKTHFLINPIYQYKFGWKPRKQAGWISKIPFVRNFVTTCVYYLIRRG
jgi:SAM-dependent methyltransferase